MDPRMVSLRGVGSPLIPPQCYNRGNASGRLFSISTPVLGDIFRNARIFDENLTVILADAASYLSR
jgi:hypothetical protein